MIGVLDYGVGNIRAFQNVYMELGIPCKAISTVSDFEAVSHFILPGVGSFDYAMTSLNESGLKHRLEHLVFKGIPVLGVCIGMQMMGRSSEEGTQKGLGWLDATSKKISFNSDDGIEPLPLPHMGWNTINVRQNNQLLEEIGAKEYFYFLHSYYLSCNDSNIIYAEAKYGVNITSLVQKGNIYGIQQHPEKSHDAGIKFLENFWRI